MTTDDKIRNEKLQYDISTEIAKITVLSSYLKAQEILSKKSDRTS